MADADAVAALSLERSTRALLSALTSFAGSLLRPHKLRDLNAAINGKSYDAVLGYYAARPELARFTLERELDRMDYVVRTADGDELATPAAIRSFHGGLPANEQEGLLWRLANQSLLADVIGEMTLAGYVDMDLTAAVRATAVKYVLDLGAQLLRVTATVGVFVPLPDDGGARRRADGGARPAGARRGGAEGVTARATAAATSTPTRCSSCGSPCTASEARGAFADRRGCDGHRFPCAAKKQPTIPRRECRRSRAILPCAMPGCPRRRRTPGAAVRCGEPRAAAPVGGAAPAEDAEAPTPTMGEHLRAPRR